MPNPIEYPIEQGATFRARLLCLQPSLAVKAITAISNSSRPVVACTGHGIPAGVDFPVWVRGVKGMLAINHSAADVNDADQSVAYLAARSNDDSLILAKDTLDLPAYTSGGELVYQLPYDFAGAVARMDIRQSIADTLPALSLSSATASPLSRLTLGSGTVDIEISDEDSAAIAWQTAVFDLEVEFSDGSVQRMAQGAFSADPEVTRP